MSVIKRTESICHYSAAHEIPRVFVVGKNAVPAKKKEIGPQEFTIRYYDMVTLFRYYKSKVDEIMRRYSSNKYAESICWMLIGNVDMT